MGKVSIKVNGNFARDRSGKALNFYSEFTPASFSVASVSALQRATRTTVAERGNVRGTFLYFPFNDFIG